MITQTALERLEAYNATHDAQEIALRDLLRSWKRSRRDRKITLVFGPAGVGKDRLIDLASHAILKEAPGARIIRVQTTAGFGRSAFSMKAFMVLLLTKLGDPAPTRHNLTNEHQRKKVESYFTSQTGQALGAAVRERLAALRPAALFINEANYLAPGRPDQLESNAQIESNMRVLTGLADTTGVPIILLGTYPTLRLCKAGTDVNRRLKLIHFPRYGDAAESLQHFGRAADKFGSFLVTHKIAPAGFSLRSAQILSDLYATSFGLVGVLRDLILVAAHDAHEEGRLLTLKDIHVARESALGDPGDFARQLIQGERTAALSGRPNRYPFKQKEPAESKSETTAKKRAPARTTPVGEQKLGRNKAFGVLEMNPYA